MRADRGLWAAHALSLAGRATHAFAQAWLVHRLTGSAAWLALVAAAAALPVVLLAPFAGRLVDRVPRRSALLATQGCAMLLALSAAALAAAGRLDAGTILALALAFGVVAAFDAPAVQAWLFARTPGAPLARAVTRHALATNFARAVAPFAAAGLLVEGGAAACFLLNAASFVPLLVLVARSPHGQRALAAPAAEGIVRDGPGLYAAACAAFFAVPCVTLLPARVLDASAGEPAALAFATAALGAGSLVAPLLVAGRMRADARGTTVALAALGTALAALAGAPSLLLLCVAAFAAGAGISATLALSAHALHAGAGDAARGRIAARYSAIVLGAPLAGNLVAGALAAALGAAGAMAVLGALLACAALVPCATPSASSQSYRPSNSAS